MRNHPLRVKTLALSTAFLCSNALAGTVTTSFDVKITITASCTVGAASTVNFGSVAGTAATPSPLATAFNVTCTNGTPYDVTFGGLNDVNDVDKRMAGPGGASIKYAITSDSAGTMKLGKTLGAPAGTGGTGLDAVGTGAAVATTVYAAIDTTGWTSLAAKPGAYTDTVTVTVNF